MKLFVDIKYRYLTKLCVLSQALGLVLWMSPLEVGGRGAPWKKVSNTVTISPFPMDRRKFLPHGIYRVLTR